jgi:hypothetical protein
VFVWLLRNGNPVPAEITIGVSDGQSVEVTAGAIRPGDPVIIAAVRGGRRPRLAARRRSRPSTPAAYVQDAEVVLSQVSFASHGHEPADLGMQGFAFPLRPRHVARVGVEFVDE